MYGSAAESSASLTGFTSVATRRVHHDLSAIRLFDIVASLLILAFISPLMLVIAVLVSRHDGGPALFGHTRLGKGGRPFRCLKFRSMVVDSEQRLQALLAADPVARLEWERDHKLRKDPRVTALGEFLRRSSLDELPQLINVLSGEMSLVGPRPISAAEAPRYGRHFRRYCQVRPGLTGLWQVSGRSDVDYRRRVVMDVAFVRNRSLALYFRILLATGPAVLLSRGSC